MCFSDLIKYIWLIYKVFFRKALKTVVDVFKEGILYSKMHNLKLYSEVFIVFQRKTIRKLGMH